MSFNIISSPYNQESIFNSMAKLIVLQVRDLLQNKNV